MGVFILRSLPCQARGWWWLLSSATVLSSRPIVLAYSSARPHSLGPTPYPVVSPGMLFSSPYLVYSFRNSALKELPSSTLFEPAIFSFLPRLGQIQAPALCHALLQVAGI